MTMLMKCGCRAQGHLTAMGGEKVDPPVPGCVIHDCYEPADAPDLTGRMAECAYRHDKPQPARNISMGWTRGTSPRPSSLDLAFFKYRGPGSREATEICKCGYAKSAHDPRWRCQIHVAQRWFKIERYESDITKEGHAPDEAAAKAWAEREANSLRQMKGKDTKVFSAEVVDVARIPSPLKCQRFVPHGPHETDEFYCGCFGWD